MPVKIPSELQYELLVLLYAERHGREIAEAYERAHRREISYGSLYTTLRRLRDEGFVKVTREGSDEDGRFKYYRITGLGSKAVEAADDHLRETARRRGIVGEGAT